MRSWVHKHPYVFFILPGLALYGVFMFYPLLSSLVYSFYHWDGLVRGVFVGLRNFGGVLFGTDSVRFWGALRHNLLFFAGTFVIQSTFGLLVAWLFYRGGRGTRFYQTIYFLPYTLSLVIVGFLWMMMLNPIWGIVPALLKGAGLGALAKPWLGEITLALPTIIVVNAWRWLGFPIMVFLAGLQGIPRDYFEAAAIDGAGGWQIFRRITLPLLFPTLAVVTILAFIWSFNQFDLIYVMQGSSGAPSYSTDVLGTFFYRTAFGNPTTGGEPGRIGIASAIGTLMFTITSLFAVFGIRQMQKGRVDY